MTSYTSAEWASTNPVLSLGQMGYDTTAKDYKVGNGYTPWISLGYAGADNQPIFLSGSIIFSDGLGYSQDNANLNYSVTNKALTVGTNMILAVGNVINGVLSTPNSTTQFNVQNTSNSNAASTDHICTADNGNNTTNYIDLGINSSTYNQAAYSATVALDGYLYVQGNGTNNIGNLGIGTASPLTQINFFVAGTQTSNIVFTITPTVSTFTNPVITPNTFEGLVSTVTAAGTTTLTMSSAYMQMFTGTTTQTVTMPVTTTLTVGAQWLFQNRSTGAVTVQSSGANSIVVISAGSNAHVTCILASGVTAASWDSHSF